MFRRYVITLTIFTLILSSILPVQLFADDGIGYEGRVCRDLGILKGNTGVVDRDYLETRPSRLQAAIMFLRLKGLEEDALSYAGRNNFKDADAIKWKEGRNVLSYLKDHPELGWIGDGVNFLPYNLIDSKAYYKVLLESLDYKQKIDGDGDFAWSSVLDFAAKKGLDKVANEENFTVRSLAIATVEALETNMNNSNKKLIEYLVDIGDVDKGDAIALGLYSKGLKATVKAVKAISNSKIEVIFEEAVDGSAADEENLYDIGHLDIKDVSVKNASAVIIDTSAMNEGTTYTLVFNNKSYSFRGLRKDSYAPGLISAECKDTNLVELAFDRVLDNETAQDSDTYSIKGATVRSAELDSTNTKVRLITSGIISGRTYELKIRGIRNGDGVITKSITKKFTGKKDTAPPKLNKLTVLNNVKLMLEFSDNNGLDKASAEDDDNYRITSESGDLEVISAKAKDKDDDGLWDSVELVTESQTAGRSYILRVEDLSDNSVLGNRMTREIKKEFRGKSMDKSGPTIARNPKAVTNTMVEVEFSDSNALDIESACDIDNYEIDEDLEIIEIRIKDEENPYSAEGRTVLLITSEMEKSESYTLKINYIQDEFGNEIKASSSSKTYRFKGLAEDRTPPYIIFVECIDRKTIELSFDNSVDEKSAENIGNYRLDGLALVTKSVLKEDGKTVRLTVSSLSSDKDHTVLLNNIKDLSGNALSNVSVSILYNGNLYDDDSPEIADIDAVNEREVWLQFDEKVYTENARIKASGIDFYQVGSVLEDGTTVVMKASESMDDEEYEVYSLTGVWDLRNNPYELEDNLDFYGTDSENDPPEVDYWDQMDVRRFRVVFSEPVLLKGNGISGIRGPAGVSINWNAILNPDEEDTNEAYSTIDYEASKNIPEDKEFKFNFTDMVSDYVGLDAYDEDDDDYGSSGSTILESYMEDDEEPYIEYVEAITRTKAQIVFSEAMRTPGSYKITYEDDNNKLRTIDIDFVEVDSKDRARVNIFTEDQMSDEYLYILEPQSAASDIAGKKLDTDDLEIEFEGSNLMSSDYIQGVEVRNANRLRVSKSSRIYKVNSLYELDTDEDAFGGSLIESTSRVSGNVYEIISKKPLLRDVRYEITVDGIEYKFYGGVPNGDIELKLPEREITYDYMNVDKHEVRVFTTDGEELDVYEGKNYFVISGSEDLINGETIYVYVERESDQVILYGTRLKVEGMPAVSSSKEIISFSFKTPDLDVVGYIDNEDDIIRLAVPYGTNLNHLAAAFECSEGAVVKVGSETQISGETENDFTKEVTYTVIAQDGSKKSYKIRVVMKESEYEKRITGFVLDELKPEVVGKIDDENHVITLELSNGTELKALRPAIEISQGTTVYPESGVENDFSEPVIYKVIAKDGSVQNYTVVAIVNLSSENYIRSFRFEGVNSYETIITTGNKNTISIKVPYNTNVAELIPIITVSDYAKITPESGAVNDFTEPVTYTVVAQDGSTLDYTVTVAVELNNEKLIKEFGFAAPKAIGIIDGAAGSIIVKVPYGTDITKLVAVFNSSADSIVKVDDDIQKSGETVKDFTHPVKYTVVAQDGSTRVYTVTVAAAVESEKYFTDFAFTGLNPTVKGMIDQHNHIIEILLPSETDVSNLVASFSFIGKSVYVGEVRQYSDKTANDFSREVVYKVIADDDSFSEYTVIVTVPKDEE